MGREAIAVAHWRGEAAEVKALLESTEIILRGDIRARIRRDAIEAVAVEEDALAVTTDGERLILELGEAEAAKWAARLLAPPPTLADKFGLSPSKPAFVLGEAGDNALAAALDGATAADPAQAAMLVAMLASPADLDATLALAVAHPTLPTWCVYGKGKAAAVTDAQVRAAFRDAGFVDTKSSAVSDRWTATRYARRK